MYGFLGKAGSGRGQFRFRLRLESLLLVSKSLMPSAEFDDATELVETYGPSQSFLSTLVCSTSCRLWQISSSSLSSSVPTRPSCERSNLTLVFERRSWDWKVMSAAPFHSEYL